MIGLSFLKAGVFIQTEFIRDDTKNIVIDTSTNLMWQDDANVTSITKNWQDAIDYCENLTLGGHSDWHLPSKNELQSITDSSKYNPPISSVFQHTNSSVYWSSTTVESAPSIAWYVQFYYGGDDWGTKTSDIYVRCVR